MIPFIETISNEFKYVIDKKRICFVYFVYLSQMVNKMIIYNVITRVNPTCELYFKSGDHSSIIF